MATATRTTTPATLLSNAEEELLARLTRTAYEVALRHRPDGSFLELELGLWAALREVLEEEVLVPAPRDPARVVQWA